MSPCVLQEEAAKTPTDSRSWLYLASTYAGVGNHTASLHAYQTLASISKWDEEVYHALLACAEQARELSQPWQTSLNYYLKAHQYLPRKVDALHAITQEYFNTEQYHLAFLFGINMLRIKMPSNLGLVQVSLFHLHKLAICLIPCGHSARVVALSVRMSCFVTLDIFMNGNVLVCLVL